MGWRLGARYMSSEVGLAVESRFGENEEVAEVVVVVCWLL